MVCREFFILVVDHSAGRGEVERVFPHTDYGIATSLSNSLGPNHTRRAPRTIGHAWILPLQVLGRTGAKGYESVLDLLAAGVPAWRSRC